MLVPVRRDGPVPSPGVSASDTTTSQQSLLRDVEALVTAILGEAPVSDLIAITNRIAVAVDYWDGIPAGAIADLRSAIDLMCGGKTCATVSALLAARSELNTSQ